MLGGDGEVSAALGGDGEGSTVLGRDGEGSAVVGAQNPGVDEGPRIGKRQIISFSARVFCNSFEILPNLKGFRKSINLGIGGILKIQFQQFYEPNKTNISEFPITITFNFCQLQRTKRPLKHSQHHAFRIP